MEQKRRLIYIYMAQYTAKNWKMDLSRCTALKILRVDDNNSKLKLPSAEKVENLDY